MRKLITILLVFITSIGFAQMSVIGDTAEITGGGSFGQTLLILNKTTSISDTVLVDSLGWLKKRTITGLVGFWSQTLGHIYPTTETDSVMIGGNSPNAILEVAGRIEISGTGNSVFIGKDAGLIDDLTSNNNVFIGESTGSGNQIGTNNTFVGYQANTTSTAASFNTIIGSTSLISLSVGDNNTSIGESAGQFYGSGSNVVTNSSSSTFVGDNVRPAANAQTNQTVVGANAIGNGTDTFTAGDDNTTHVWMNEDGTAIVQLGDVNFDNGATIDNDDADTLEYNEANHKFVGDTWTDGSIGTITTDTDLLFAPNGTGVLSVVGTTDYETNVTFDDAIPNKKYVDDQIGTTVSFIKTTLSAAQVDNLGTAKTLVAAPGGGNILQIIAISWRVVVATQIEAGAQTLEIGITGGAIDYMSISNAHVESAATFILQLAPAQNGELKDNGALQCVLSGAADPNVTSDATMDFYITYRIVTL